MDKDDADGILEGEIVDEPREVSPPLPAVTAPASGAVKTKGWIEMIAAIGGGIARWLVSSSGDRSLRGREQDRERERRRQDKAAARRRPMRAPFEKSHDARHSRLDGCAV